MPLLKRTGSTLGLALALLAAESASGHSLKDVEAILGDKELFFQPMDEEAPEFSLRSAEGETVRLADFRGKVVVLHFIYASCPDVCPLHADRTAKVQEMVNRTPMKEHVRFISITTDPENDTPDVLRGYGPSHGLDSINWVFLTTTPGQPEDTTRRLAEAYGHTFIKTGTGYQVHGIVTHVIDNEGRWRANFHGLKFEPVNLVTFINALVNDHHDENERSDGFWDRLRELF